MFQIHIEPNFKDKGWSRRAKSQICPFRGCNTFTVSRENLMALVLGAHRQPGDHFFFPVSILLLLMGKVWSTECYLQDCPMRFRAIIRTKPLSRDDVSNKRQKARFPRRQKAWQSLDSYSMSCTYLLTTHRTAGFNRRHGMRPAWKRRWTMRSLSIWTQRPAFTSGPKPPPTFIYDTGCSQIRLCRLSFWRQKAHRSTLSYQMPGNQWNRL